MSQMRIQALPKKSGLARLYADDRSIICAAPNGALVVIDRATRKVAASLDGHSAQNPILLDCPGVILHPDGKRVITFCGRLIQVWRRADWNRLCSIEISASCVALHPKGALLAATTYSGFRLAFWNLDTGARIQEPLVEFVATELVVRDDGLALASCFGGDVHIWDVRQLKKRPVVVSSLPTGGSDCCIQITGDSKTIVLESRGSVKVWKWRDEWFEQGETTKRWGQPTQWVRKQRGGQDCASFTWKGKPDHIIKTRGRSSVALMTNGSAVIGSDAGVIVYALDSGKKIRSMVGASVGVRRLSVASGIVAATSLSAAFAWEIETGKQLVEHRQAGAVDCVVAAGQLAIGFGDGGVTFVPLPG